MGVEKLKNLNELKAIIDSYKSMQKVIVFTNGCFDIIHAGHIKLLQEARSFGDILIVGVNSDKSVKKIKGDSRPVVNQDDRSFVLSAIESVDYIVIFDEDTPVNIISVLKPDIHVKGGDYNMDMIPEAEIVKSYGGCLRSVSVVPGRSTTSLIKRMQNE